MQMPHNSAWLCDYTVCMKSTDSPLSAVQAVTLAGRVLCVFFLFWAIFNLTEVPGYVMTLIRYGTHAEGPAALEYYRYWTRRYALYVLWALLRAAIQLWFAGFFYRCGPKAARFLLGEDAVEATESSPGETLG